jgi:hypothetical protein
MHGETVKSGEILFTKANVNYRVFTRRLLTIFVTAVLKLNYRLVFILLIPVATRSKVWICDRSHAGILGSNPIKDLGVCLLELLCVVR